MARKMHGDSQCECDPAFLGRYHIISKNKDIFQVHRPGPIEEK